MPNSVEGLLEVCDGGQRQSVDIRAQARNVLKVLPQKKLDARGSLFKRPSCLPDDPIGLETELNW